MQPNICLAASARNMATVDQYSLLDDDVPSAEQKGRVSKERLRQTGSLSVSAAIGRENARLGTPGAPIPRFPGEDSGHSLAEMARADLDAALQLLAERAQYITAASGVAIALRRGEHDDMLCRARAGSNAPELGALLSMEYGLSGESVRTREMLRCDDTERDPRVNHDLCRELGIASVVITPILKEQQVFGIFELLSSTTSAFNDRDLSALTRLSEMVATAVTNSCLDLEAIAPARQAHRPATNAGIEGPTRQANSPAAKPPSERLAEPKPSPTRAEPANLVKRPLFWSAALQADAGSRAAQGAENSAVPAVLRNLKKCQACGFPISQGRTVCVECEEKRWRGRNPAQSTAGQPSETVRSPSQTAGAQQEAAAQILDSASAARPQPVVELALAATASAGSGIMEIRGAQADGAVRSAIATPSREKPSAHENGERADNPVVASPSLLLSSAMPTESWLAANKYILIALLVVALAIASIAVLR